MEGREGHGSENFFFPLLFRNPTQPFRTLPKVQPAQKIFSSTRNHLNLHLLNSELLLRIILHRRLSKNGSVTLPMEGTTLSGWTKRRCPHVRPACKVRGGVHHLGRLGQCRAIDQKSALPCGLVYKMFSVEARSTVCHRLRKPHASCLLFGLSHVGNASEEVRRHGSRILPCHWRNDVLNRIE